MAVRLLTALYLAVAVLVMAQTPIDVERIGPQPGALVSEFTARDQSGVERTLQSLLGPKGAMLVFSRSADW